tara:strand:+ start:787 stop:1131 length:345 start_codon:yes stop_codon:yes gene_type:complete
MDDRYLDFFDDMTKKYDYKSIPPRSPYGSRGKFSRVHRELRVVLECITKESGFNTNAPPTRYKKARELFDELEENLGASRDPEHNARMLKRARWCLFQKFDHMEARECLEEVLV